jgi:hypothetical protein
MHNLARLRPLILILGVHEAESLTKLAQRNYIER